MKLADQTSLFLRSTHTPVGFARLVFGPLITLFGATSPLSVTLNTRIELPMSFATYSSPRCSSIARPVGQLNCVFGPWLTRSAGTFPCAFMPWTMIDGGRLLPEPGPAAARAHGP